MNYKTLILMSALLAGCTDFQTTPTEPKTEEVIEEDTTKNYTLDDPNRFWFQFFYDSLYEEQIPRADGTIIEPGTGVMISGNSNPYTYKPADIPDEAFVLVVDRYDSFKVRECHSWAETIACPTTEFLLDTFFIPWERVSPGEEF